MITTITNQFTGYSATIRTNKIPAISTLRKHLRQSKAKNCTSETKIHMDGQEVEISDMGWIGGPKILAK